jgi:hypothetical protein
MYVWASAFRLASDNELEEIFSLDKNSPSISSLAFEIVRLFLQ